MRVLLIVCATCFIFSCAPGEQVNVKSKVSKEMFDSFKNQEGRRKDSLGSSGFDQIPEHGYDEAIANGIDPSSGLPIRLVEAVDDYVPGWRIVDRALWYAEDFAPKTEFERFGELPTAYEGQIYAQADFNGDALDDFAVFLVNEEDVVVLYVLEQLESGYEAIVIKEFDHFVGCCLAAGVMSIEPEVYFVLDDADFRVTWELEYSGVFFWNYNGEAFIYQCESDDGYFGALFDDL